MHTEILLTASLVLFHSAPASAYFDKYDRKKLISNKYEFEYEFKALPTKRPMTLVEVGIRKLKPIRVIPSVTPCIFQRYTHLLQAAEVLQAHPLEIVLEAKTNFTDKDYYLYDPEDLCIDIDDDLVTDVYKFDCSETDVCICGKYYGYVDPNVEQPDPIEKVRTYVAINGLDRKLAGEDGKCVSGHKGHCTPKNSTAVEALPCRRSHECILDDSYGTILKNKQKNYMYGLCLPKAPIVPSGDNMIAYEAFAGSPPNHTPTIHTLIFIVTILENIAFAKALLFNN